MKDKNDKHKFKESKIGKIIYAFLLFMPLFAIGVTCGYAMFNKNAKDSYTGKIEYKQTLNVTSSNQYINDVVYFTKESAKLPYNGQIFNITILQVEEQFNSADYEYNYYSFKATDSTHCAIYGHQIKKDAENTIQTTQLKSIVWSYSAQKRMVEKLSFEDLYYDSYSSYLLTFFNQFYYNDYYVDNDVSNVFYYSVDKVTQSSLFNWVTTSNIYTGMSNFTTAMSVTNTFIPMLLTYWLIISVIYFLYDMVLILLTVLHRKIHNLQDSV